MAEDDRSDVERRRRRFVAGAEDSGAAGLTVRRPAARTDDDDEDADEDVGAGAEKADSPVRIVQSGGRWCIETIDGSMRFGCYKRRSSAERRKRAIDASAERGGGLPHVSESV